MLFVVLHTDAMKMCDCLQVTILGIKYLEDRYVRLEEYLLDKENIL